MADTGVVYLYRFAEGEACVQSFLSSYRSHQAGLDHDLHVIFKGIPNRDALAQARALFGTIPFNAIEVDDTGYDIGSYFTAAQRVTNRQLIFLNTFSEILADNWLYHFDQALRLPGVGVVGATGSWQSLTAGYDATFFRIFRNLLTPKDWLFTSTKRGAVNSGREQINTWRLIRKLSRMPLYPLYLFEYGRYPNPHIRTNAFMIQREVFLSLGGAHFRRKNDVYKFESGRSSMTKQILRRGMTPLVVDRSGRSYEISGWKLSSTFWTDDQANLLVSDNQTRDYTNGSPERRRLLKNYAWNHPSSWFG